MNTKYLDKALGTLAIFVVIVAIFGTSNRNVMAQDPFPVKVGLVTDENGIADMSFNWMAYQGLENAENILGIDGTLYESAGPNDYEPLLQLCADDGNQLCFSVGFLMAHDTDVVATANPGTAFAILDMNNDANLPNLRGIRFDEKEVGYLAGALAGKMTNNNAVGVVGGWPIQPVVDFAEGYRNGAQCANPELDVLIQYINDWNNPELGVATAQEMIVNGADVIFAAAGATGNGAILSSAQQGVWSIGVDTDQYLTTFENGTVTGADYLLTSAMKKLDFAVYQTIDDYLNTIFSGGTVTYHLSDGGVGLAPYHGADPNIPQSSKDYVNDVKADIIKGKVNVHEDCRPIGSPAHPIKIFFTPSVDPQVIYEGGAVMADYLSQETGLSFEIIVPASYADTVVEMCASPEDSVGFLPGVGYVLAKKLCGAKVAYKAIRFGWDVYWSEILIPRDSPIQSIADLNGLTWGIPSYSSYSGYIAPLAMWHNAEITPGEIVETGSHPQAVMDVYHGDVDFATVYFSPPIKPEGQDPWQPGDPPDIPDELVESCVVEEGQLLCSGWQVMDARNSIRFEAEDVVQNVRILAISDPIANDAFAFGKGFPSAQREQIKNALVAFAETEGWWESIGRPDFYNWTGLAPASSEDYDSTREIVKAAGINLGNWGYNPSFSARVTENQVHGYGWPLGAKVYLTVDGTVFGPETAVQADWDPNETFVWFDLGESLSLQGGQFLKMTDGFNIKTHTVTNLVITGVDTDADTVFGTADAGTQVDIGHIYCDEFGCYGFRREIADINGNWVADFSVPGEDDDEQDIIDILPGVSNEARQCDYDGDCTQYGLDVPNPHFSVFPMWDSVELWEWSEGTFVTATVSEKLECYAEGIVEGYRWETNLWMDFPENCDVMVGDVVTLEAEGILTQTHEVRYLSVTSVDADADTVQGAADPDTIVYVWPHWYGEFEQQPTTDGNGIWLADFGAVGLDLSPGMNGRSEIRDENGNTTAVDWRVPNPHLTVYPEWEAVEAWDWPDGAIVTASVDGKPECEVEGISTYPEWDRSTTNVWMDFSGECDVVSGDILIITAQGVEPKTYVIQNLSIIEVNAEADTVTGTADTGEMVYLWPHCCGEYEVTPVAVEDMWLADFTAVGFDLTPGIDGRAEVRDDYGNATAIDWRVPNPVIAVRANDDWIEGWEWPLDATLTIEINDPLTEADPDFSITDIIVQIPEWDPYTTWFEINLQDIFDLQVGHEITATDGKTTKYHKITNLSFTDIYLAEDIVYGTATPDGWISVWVCDDEHCVNRDENVDEFGFWDADFSTPGDQEWESETFDIQPGTWVDSQEEDEDGDQTMFGKNIPNPRLDAWPNADYVDAWDWAPGLPLTLTIDDRDNGPGVDYTETQTPDYPDWDPNQTYAQFYFQGIFDLQPGDIIKLQNDLQFKVYTVTHLTVTGFNLDLDQVVGVATPESTVWIWVCDDTSCATRREIASSDGNWTADFGLPGEEPWEELVWDLIPGTSGGAGEQEDDGDSTIVDWWVTTPSIP